MKRMWTRILLDTPLDDGSVLLAGGPPLALPESLARWLESSQTKRAEIISYATDAELDASQSALAALTSWDEYLPANAYNSARMRRARDLMANLQFPYPTIAFDFSEQVGNQVFDLVSQRWATLNAGSVQWDPTRGVRFLGTGAFQFAAGTFDGIAGEICDLSTLGLDEGIVVALVYQHGVGMTGTNPMFYYGCSGENVYGGWGLSARGGGKLAFQYRAQGSSSEMSSVLHNRFPDENNNTLSALCCEIRINPADPDYFEIASHDRPIEVGASINTTGLSNNAYVSVKGTGGTAPARRSALGSLTIGGKPNATYTALSQVAGTPPLQAGLRRLYIQRAPYIPGRFSAVLQAMAANPQAHPLPLFTEA